MGCDCSLCVGNGKDKGRLVAKQECLNKNDFINRNKKHKTKIKSSTSPDQNIHCIASMEDDIPLNQSFHDHHNNNNHNNNISPHDSSDENISTTDNIHNSDANNEQPLDIPTSFGFQNDGNTNDNTDDPVIDPPIDPPIYRLIQIGIDNTTFKTKGNTNIDKDKIKKYFNKWIKDNNITIESFKKIKKKTFAADKWVNQLNMVKVSGIRLYTNIMNEIKNYTASGLQQNIEKSIDNNRANAIPPKTSLCKPRESPFTFIMIDAIDKTTFIKAKTAKDKTIDKNEIKLYFKNWVIKKNVTKESFKKMSRKQFTSHQWVNDLTLGKVSAAKLYKNIIYCIDNASNVYDDWSDVDEIEKKDTFIMDPDDFIPSHSKLPSLDNPPTIQQQRSMIGVKQDIDTIQIMEAAIDDTDFKKDIKASDQSIDKLQIKLYFKKWLTNHKIDAMSRKEFISDDWVNELEMKKVSATRLYQNILKQINSRKTNRFMTEILDHDPPQQLQTTDDIKSSNDNNGMDHDVAMDVCPYSFGEQMEYWRQNKANYVAPKYSNLKEEMLSNKVNLATNVFEGMIKKANEIYDQVQHYLPTNGYAKHNKAWNKLFQIKPGTRIDINHLTALLLYTDIDDIQTNFKALCRTAVGINEIKLAQSNYCIWLKLLKETIMLYGDEYHKESGNIKDIYHGLSRRLVFDKFEAEFMMPLSTTLNSTVAQNFCKDLSEGIIVVLRSTENYPQYYFSVSPISAYPNEDELLFFSCLLSIKSIKFVDINISTEVNDGKPYIKAITLLQTIMDGNIIAKTPKKHKQKLLKQFIISKKENNTKVDSAITSIYYYKLFNNLYDYYLNNDKDGSIWFNQDQIDKYISQSLKNLICDIPHNNAQTFEWNIHGDEIKNLKSGVYKQPITSDERLVTFNDKLSIQLFCGMKRKEVLSINRTTGDQVDEKTYDCVFMLKVCQINIISNQSDNNVDSIKLWFDMYSEELKYYLRVPVNILNSPRIIKNTLFRSAKLTAPQIKWTLSIKCCENHS